jgi:hypothetical protein
MATSGSAAAQWGKGESPGTAPLMNPSTPPLMSTEERTSTTVRPEEGVQKLPAKVVLSTNVQNRITGEFWSSLYCCCRNVIGLTCSRRCLSDPQNPVNMIRY